MIGRNDPCFCGSGKKYKKCHFPELPKEVINEQLLHQWYARQYQINLKTEEQIHKIKAACALAASILKQTCALAKAGVTTNELNAFAHQLHLDVGAIPAPLGYGSPPFPKSICTSINDVVCHGIPDDHPLQEGDILNIDVSPILDGYYGDCSAMVTIGAINPDKRLVVDVAFECLYKAIALLKPSVPLFAIGNAISDYAEEMGCSVVYQFVGHGVGLDFHEAPQIYHHRNHLDIPLAPGMIFTIEPMINRGVPETIFDANQWTARTKDGLPSAQWEHTVLITETGHEILTTG